MVVRFVVTSIWFSNFCSLLVHLTSQASQPNVALNSCRSGELEITLDYYAEKITIAVCNS